MQNSIEDVLIGGNHLTTVLLNNDITPSKIISPDDINDVDLRNVFIAWQAIMNLSNNSVEILTSTEAEQLWKLKPGTVRRACREGRLKARKSAGTWLTTKGEMVKQYGKIPATSS